MSDLKDLVKQRGNIKTRFTLFEKYLKPLMDLNDISALQINELRVRLSKIREVSCTYEEVQSQIEMLDEDITKQMQERESTENLFYNLIAKGQSLLDFFENKNKVESSSNNSGKCHSNLKLPPLKISLFNGDPNKWLSFRDTYLSLIHQNECIEDVNKFHYLKSYLEGSASSVISSVTVSANNYAIAWNLLCERYDNKRLLINEHLKCLFSIEPLQKESESGIRRLIDDLSKNLSALNSLGEPTDKWDTIIIYMAAAKLDTATARNWEEFRSKLDSPSLEQFYSYLRQRAAVLETIHSNNKSYKPEKRHSLPNMKSYVCNFSDATSKLCCPICKQEHKIYECSVLKSLPIQQRISKISSLKLCHNCLRKGHMPFQCRMSGCKICNRKHNTLLHKQASLQSAQFTQNSESTSEVNLPGPVGESNPSSPAASVSMSAVTTNQALLSTALVKVTHNDKIFILRALLDCASQSSFITDRAQRELGICKRKNYYHSVTGIGNSVLNVTEHCTIMFKSVYNSFNASVKCFVLPKIADKLPQSEVCVQSLGIPENIQLADPKFYLPSEIDLLLGADIFWDIIRSDRLSLGLQKPILLDTELGWIVAGSVPAEHYNNKRTIHCNFSQEIKNQLAKFWELEEIPDTINYNSDNYCEKLFTETTRRNDDGRFIVQIPLKGSVENLGESYNIAEKRLIQLERKFNNKPQLKEEYTKFIHEYESLGHMTEIPKPFFGNYLPHHAVIKEASQTTKLRVVFDASAKTTSGVSFNDLQHVGPVVQDDLFSILLRYRQHKFVVSADVEKMYRQIMVDDTQRNLQLILWRDNSSEPIKVFQLNTISYGTASAPFLSTRCLVQLSNECEDSTVSQQIKYGFYVDDYLSGAESESELINIKQSVTAALNSACLPLRKWRTNAPAIFDNDSSTSQPKNLDLTSQSSVLGLKWNPSKDVFVFPVDIEHSPSATKRAILSSSAKLFDPLGLLSPCTIVPKIILQKLWLSKLEWDDPIDSSLEKQWLKFITNLKSLSNLEIPRFVLIDKAVLIELHAFSDASQAAYASAIYLRSINSAGNISVRLLCSKTKVAPVKSTTIPRLELLGSLLSARLSAKVLTALRCKIDSVFYWTDSTVVLGWLASQPSNLKMFVANRVSEIQQLTASHTWKHVSGHDNPADLASRGLNPTSIHSAKLWWEGPTFLYKDQCDWPQMIDLKTSDLPETKPHQLATLHCNVEAAFSIVDFERFSKFSILLRAMCYVLRFINNLRNKNNKVKGPFSTDEQSKSLNVLIKQHQQECFADEIKIIKNNNTLPAKSRILSLSPFIDDSGILCVGGRLQKSAETYERKHPILLDSNNNLTKLIFAHHHIRLLHCGPQLLLSDLRNKYWPLRGRILARSTVNNCKLCRIIKAKCINPIMGNLPSSRIIPNLPFQISGVDFAGPYYITDRKGRGCKISKCYMCLFICFTTKAVHLEVASDLTTDVFILCLRRFIARRGKPSVLHCDNGTNFVGANNDIANFLKNNSKNVEGFAADEGIQFKFSPACSPHFGGLWEAGVKAAKYHTTRILGDRHLTFEELSSLFSQIEAILNSRPLTPLSSDPSDLDPLTPAHFLIGRSLTSLPSENLIEANPNRLNRYQLLESMRQHFWERWRREYLSELQQRLKWRVKERGLQEGELVIVRDANLPPLKWRMARIEKLYPGSDGVLRVADVRTSKGILRRATHNLCPLPDSTSPAVPRNPAVSERGGRCSRPLSSHDVTTESPPEGGARVPLR